jgi:hypothetical protein
MYCPAAQLVEDDEARLVVPTMGIAASYSREKYSGDVGYPGTVLRSDPVPTGSWTSVTRDTSDAFTWYNGTTSTAAFKVNEQVPWKTPR